MAFDILSFAIGKAAGGGAEEVETSVALDFSGGDMEVTPNEGEAFSKVTIPQPETLVAENIAEGIDIAGIIGTFAGGGGGNVVSAFKYVKPTDGQSFTVEHGLGVKPDIAIAYAGSSKNLNATGVYLLAFGCSKTFTDAGGRFASNSAIFSNASGDLSFMGGYGNIDVSGSRYLIDANETSITFSSPVTNITWNTSGSYNLYTIGGLT